MQIHSLIIATLLINGQAVNILPSNSCLSIKESGKESGKYVCQKVEKDNESESNDSDTTNNIKELIDQADKTLDERDLSKAISKYKSIISKSQDILNNESLTHCYKKIGIANTLLKDYDEAIKNFNLALKLNDNKADSASILSTVSIKYSLARAFESKGDIDNAMAVSQSALNLAREKLSDSPYLVRRLIALKSQLYFSHVAQKLEVSKDDDHKGNKIESSEHPSSYSLDSKLKGQISSADYFKAKSLISEVPSLDTSLLKTKTLKAKTKKRVAFSASEKLKNDLSRKLLEYGTMGVSLKKEIPGCPWHVRFVFKGGAGARYGVKKGDIINTIDGHPIKKLPITKIYHMFCGRRGDVRTLGITRNYKRKYIRLRLISVYDINYKPTEYIEYYWFLLYNRYITMKQYAKLAKPYEKYLK